MKFTEHEPLKEEYAIRSIPFMGYVTEEVGEVELYAVFATHLEDILDDWWMCIGVCKEEQLSSLLENADQQLNNPEDKENLDRIIPTFGVTWEEVEQNTRDTCAMHKVATHFSHHEDFWQREMTTIPLDVLKEKRRNGEIQVKLIDPEEDPSAVIAAQAYLNSQN